jgi:hypothetical protein
MDLAGECDPIGIRKLIRQRSGEPKGERVVIGRIAATDRVDQVARHVPTVHAPNRRLAMATLRNHSDRLPKTKRRRLESGNNSSAGEPAGPIRVSAVPAVRIAGQATSIDPLSGANQSPESKRRILITPPAAPVNNGFVVSWGDGDGSLRWLHGGGLATIMP